MIKAVFFDLEGVVLKNTRRTTELNIASLLGGTTKDLKRLWARYRRPLLTGWLKAHQFSQLLDEQFNLEQGRGQQIWRQCYREGLTFDPVVLTVAHHLTRRGCIVGMLSNLMDESLVVIKDQPELKSFAPQLFSCETRLMKPDLVTYKFAAESVRCSPDEMMLIDDLPVNVGAALQAGWQAITYVTGETDLVAELQRRNPSWSF